MPCREGNGSDNAEAAIRADIGTSRAVIDVAKHQGLASLSGFPFEVRTSASTREQAGRLAIGGHSGAPPTPAQTSCPATAGPAKATPPPTSIPAPGGVGWLLSKTGTPRRIKAAYVTDADIADLAAYATILRGHRSAA
jgi:hypothetical protein